MDLQLNPVEVRVLGAMLEKEAATPDYYPLTLNALCAACNQKSNRAPVMELSESLVAAAIEELRRKGLAREISGAGHRVHKFGHRLGEAFNLDRREQAVLCVLMLRGPQTTGEIRSRTDRMYEFDDLDAVESTLRRLAERTPPLAVELPRRPGEKEPRHAHLLSGEPDVAAEAPPAPVRTSPYEERLSRLEDELARLREEFEEFRGKFE